MKRLLIPLALMLGCLFATAARASLDDVVNATCRITAADGGVGTGCVFDQQGDSYLVLTNEHVVSSPPGSSVQCEFWRDGYLGPKIRGQVVATWQEEKAHRDIAIVSVDSSQFGDLPPAVVPLAPRGYVAPSRVICSLGCAGGKWPTAWKGNIIDSKGPDAIIFEPPPAGGRSGSALFDEACEQIVGLIAWCDDRDHVGIAMHLDEVYAAFDGEPAKVSTSWRPSIVRTERMFPVNGLVPVAGRCVHGVSLTEHCTQCPGGQCPGGQCGPFVGGGCFGGGWRGQGQGQGQGRGSQGGQFTPGGNAYNPWNRSGGSGSGKQQVAPAPSCRCDEAGLRATLDEFIKKATTTGQQLQGDVGQAKADAAAAKQLAEQTRADLAKVTKLAAETNTDLGKLTDLTGEINKATQHSIAVEIGEVRANLETKLLPQAKEQIVARVKQDLPDLVAALLPEAKGWLATLGPPGVIAGGLMTAAAMLARKKKAPDDQ